MTDNARVERLARVLEEHECWEHPGWGTNTTLDPGFQRRMIACMLDELDVRGLPDVNALRAAIVEVESGAVFGAQDRCCVCGRCGAQEYFPVLLPHWFRCTSRDCIEAWEAMRKERKGDTVVNPDGLIGVILRVRKLYRAAQSKPKPKPDDWREKWAEVYGPKTATPMWGVAWTHMAVLRCWRERIGWKPPRCTHDWRRREVAVERADQPEPHLWTCTKCGRVESRPTPVPAPAPRRECDNCAHEKTHTFSQPCLDCIVSGSDRSEWAPKPSTVSTAKRVEKGKRGCVNCAHDEERGPQKPCSVCEKHSYWAPKPANSHPAQRTPADAFKDAARMATRMPSAFFASTPHPRPVANKMREMFAEGGWTAPPWQVQSMPEFVSGNPRGDDWLRAIWREEEAETEYRRRDWQRYLAKPRIGFVSPYPSRFVRCGLCGQRTATKAPDADVYRCSACGAETTPYMATSVDPAYQEWTRPERRMIADLRSEIDSIRAGQAAELERIRKLEADRSDWATHRDDLAADAAAKALMTFNAVRNDLDGRLREVELDLQRVQEQADFTGAATADLQLHVGRMLRAKKPAHKRAGRKGKKG